MPVIYQKMIYRDDCKRNPSVLYLMGDNDMRSGFGNQAAEMRGEPNVVGIRTKRAPGRDSADFWSDKTLDANCTKIEEDLSRVIKHLRRDGVVVCPSNGIGTGMSQMQKHCPKTFFTLEQLINSLTLISSK